MENLREIYGNILFIKPMSDVCWFIIPLAIDISTISPSEIRVMFTNLAIERGHHIVGFTGTTQKTRKIYVFIYSIYTVNIVKNYTSKNNKNNIQQQK